MKENAIGHLVKTNPIQTQTNPILSAVGGLQMDVNLYVLEDYRKKDDFVVRINKPNSNPISEKYKMNVNLYIIEDYENKSNWTLGENKPNQTQSRNNSRSKGNQEIRSVVRRIAPYIEIPVEKMLQLR